MTTDEHYYVLKKLGSFSKRKFTCNKSNNVYYWENNETFKQFLVRINNNI